MISDDRSATAPPLAELVRLEDPSFYVDPHPVYDRMRDEAPVFYYEPLDVYVLTRHADMREAARRPDLFSSERGVVLSQLQNERALDSRSVEDRFIDPEGEIFAFVDPPRHRQLRRVLMPAFSPRAINNMAVQIAQACSEVVDLVVPGEVTEVVDAIASRVPILVAAQLLGVPPGSAGLIQRWSDAREQLTAGTKTPAELAQAAADSEPMNDFLREQFQIKRAHLDDDLISVLLSEELDGAPLSEARLLTYCHQVLSVATTRSLLATFVLMLANHPDQLALLAADRTLMPAAVEEALRWTSPGRGFVRTATQDCEIAGQPIRAGQRIYLLYAAGNFDPQVFPEPQVFDITRKQELQHLSFGFGPHICIAGQLVRLETSLLFNELLNRFSSFQQVGDCVPVHHILRNGWVSLPVIFGSAVEKRTLLGESEWSPPVAGAHRLVLRARGTQR